MARDADDEQEDHENEDRLRDELAEISQAAVERRLLRGCGEAGRDIAKGRSGARRDDLRSGRSADDRCAEKDHVARIRFGRSGLCGRFLFGRERLARERRLLHVEIARNQEAPVRGNQIAGRKPDDVSRHHVAPPNFLPLPAAEDGGRRGHLIAQLVDGPLRTISLTEVHGGAQQNNDADDSRIHRFAQECRCDCGNHQDQHQRIHEHMQEIGKTRTVLCGCRLIRPEPVKPGLSFLCRQAGHRAAGFLSVGRHG